MKDQIEKFVAAAQAMIEAHNEKQGFKNDRVLVANYGRKYVRIEQRDSLTSEYGSAWAFIRLEDGAIMKPAGWKTPAPQKRGSIMTPTYGVEFVGPYGPAYLR
jgi:hypothetical protein